MIFSNPTSALLSTILVLGTTLAPPYSAHAFDINEIPVRTLEGTLIRNPEGHLELNGLHVFFPKSMKNSLQTLEQLKTPIRVDAYVDPNTQELEVLRTPTLIAGTSSARGVFTTTEEPGLYQIGTTPARLKQITENSMNGKSLNGTQIDARTIQSWINQEVVAQGELSDGVLIVEAMTPSRLFTAENAPASEEFFDVDSVFKNKISKGIRSLHKTIFPENPSYTPNAGEKAMLITLSGRQGDDIDAAGGHFAIGEATVRPDLSLDTELYNVYVQNEKRIIPGNTDGISYFGHFVGGQLNYRPTYTMILYGISPEKTKKLREILDLYHPYFQSGKFPLSINFNCTTLSVQAMGNVDLYGQHRNGKNATEKYPRLNDEKAVLLSPIQNRSNQIHFSIHNNSAEFMPRPAFMSLLKNIQKLNEKENLGVKRVDFFFTPQNISNKLRGGAPYGSSMQALAIQLEGSLAPKKSIPAILNKIE